MADSRTTDGADSSGGAGTSKLRKEKRLGGGVGKGVIDELQEGKKTGTTAAEKETRVVKMLGSQAPHTT